MAQYAIISTEKGDMKAELYTDETPGTVANFVKLAESRFYDGLTFHRAPQRSKMSRASPAVCRLKGTRGYRPSR